jgi:hypothetical protein
MFFGHILIFIGQFDFLDIRPNLGQCPVHGQDGNRNNHPQSFTGNMETALNKPANSIKHKFFP